MRPRYRRVSPGEPVDPTNKWRAKCGAMADRLGFPRAEIFHHYSQISLELRYEHSIAPPLADFCAFSLVAGCFDKQGLVPS